MHTYMYVSGHVILTFQLANQIASVGNLAGSAVVNAFDKQLNWLISYWHKDGSGVAICGL